MNDKENQQWLDALAGRADATMDPTMAAQAQALRDAMLARREEIEHATQNADPALFKKLRARLLREGLLHSPATNRQKSWLGEVWRKVLPSGTRSAALPIWGLAATVVLGIGLVVQMGLFGGNSADESEVLRGSPATTLTVANPETRLAELAAGLDAATARYTVKRQQNSDIQITVQADEAALEYLQSQRLMPVVHEGTVVIKLRMQAPSSKAQ